MKKMLFFILGSISLALGTLGIFLPILPTTPFVLLAAACFSVCSPKLLKIIEENRLFGSYISNYRYHTGVPRKTKIRALMFLWVGLLVSMFLVQKTLLVIMLIFIGTIVSVHILSLKEK